MRLGVGKNMVALIRFWWEILGLIEMQGRRGTLTPLAEFLFGSAPPAAAQKRAAPEVCAGADPYLEALGTRRLLRCAQDARATCSSFPSIKRDVDVFLRIYLLARGDRRRPLGDSVDCPLAELGLLRRAGTGRFALECGP